VQARLGTTRRREGKLDLLVTLDFRMSTTCLYSDIVLPTASWYEKNDLNTSDMHPFIHPLSAAVDPVWQVAQRLGDLQGLRQGLQRGLRRPPRRREGSGADAADARHAGRTGAAAST
jgi:anaerobic selenocysteine-containing dehydrogenase